jgi:hypothetical protein
VVFVTYNELSPLSYVKDRHDFGTQHTVVDLRAELDEYKDVLDSKHMGFPPERFVDHAIILGSEPSRKGLYRMSQDELADLRSRLEELLAKGYIRPSTSPYGAPVLFVIKKIGERRLCVDSRTLNKQTVKNSFPLTQVDTLLDQLTGARYFTKVDLAYVYHQSEFGLGCTAFRKRYGSTGNNLDEVES